MYGNSELGQNHNTYLRQIDNFIAFLGFPPEGQFEKVPWSGQSSAYGGLSSVLKFPRLLSRSTLVHIVWAPPCFTDWDVYCIYIIQVLIIFPEEIGGYV